MDGLFAVIFIGMVSLFVYFIYNKIPKADFKNLGEELQYAIRGILKSCGVSGVDRYIDYELKEIFTFISGEFDEASNMRGESPMSANQKLKIFA